MSQVIHLFLAACASICKITLKYIFVQLLILSSKFFGCVVFQYLLLMMVCVIGFIPPCRYLFRMVEVDPR